MKVKKRGTIRFFALLLSCKTHKTRKGIEPMYILTQAGLLETCADKNFRVQAANLEEMYLNSGYQRYERSYQIKCQHKEYTILCPEFRKDDGSSLPVVIIPEFLVPGRPYPIYVYLYAIDLYISNPERGQRWAAKATRKYYGLPSFAHTTLGRALKALVTNLETAGINEIEELEAESKVSVLQEGRASQKAIEEGNARQNNSHSKITRIPSVQSTWALRKRAAHFLGGKMVLCEIRQSIKIGQAFAMEWFIKYGRFLL